VQGAYDYASSVSQKVILINGNRLADLMIEHDVGVSAYRTIKLKRIDSEYFEES
jgi:restriction system protein